MIYSLMIFQRDKKKILSLPKRLTTEKGIKMATLQCDSHGRWLLKRAGPQIIDLRFRKANSELKWEGGGILIIKQRVLIHGMYRQQASPIVRLR